MIEKWAWHQNKEHAPKLPKFTPDSTYAGNHDSGLVIKEQLPKFISKPKILYPTRAYEYGKSARVFVRVLVLKDGKTKSVRIHETSDPNWLWGFNEAAIEGAKQCKFKPAKQNGKPVNCWVSFPFEFEHRR